MVGTGGRNLLYVDGSMPPGLHAFDTPTGARSALPWRDGMPYTVTIVDIRKGQQFDPDRLKSVRRQDSRDR